MPLDQEKVGMFSTEPICHLKLNDFEGMHEIQTEIEEKILERDAVHMKESEDNVD